MLTNQIREEVKNAVLAGLWDALVELQTGAVDHRAAADAFRARAAARQLPAPVEPAGLDLLAEAQAAGIDPHASNGNGKARGRKGA